MKSRFLWVAAAAMFLLSFLGFRLEVGEQGVAFQFSLLGKGDTATDARIRGLEESLIKAIELNAALTQSQLDARFNAFYQERTEDLGAFSRIVSDKMEDLEMKNALYLATVKDDLKNDLRETQLKGKLQ